MIIQKLHKRCTVVMYLFFIFFILVIFNLLSSASSWLWYGLHHRCRHHNLLTDFRREEHHGPLELQCNKMQFFSFLPNKQKMIMDTLVWCPTTQHTEITLWKKMKSNVRR